MQHQVQLDTGRRPYDPREWHDRLAIKTAIGSPTVANAFQFAEMQRCVLLDPWLLPEALLSYKPFQSEHGAYAAELWATIELARLAGKPDAKPLWELGQLEEADPSLCFALSPTRRPGTIATAVQPPPPPPYAG